LRHGRSRLENLSIRQPLQCWVNFFFLIPHDRPACVLSVKTAKSRWCWRKDLLNSRGLSDEDRAGFLLVLEWFEN
jgi:hypothetical protein